MLYRLACTGCHKKDRRGSLPLVRNLLTSEKTDAEMKVAIRDGQALMPAFSQFTDDEVDALVKYIRSPPDAAAEKSVATESKQKAWMSEGAASLVSAALAEG